MCSSDLQTQIDKNSDVFKENDISLRADVAKLRERVAEVSLGGGEKVPYNFRVMNV